VKFFRLHQTPRGSIPVDIADEEVMLYTIQDDLQEPVAGAGEAEMQEFQADKEKKLEEKVQDTIMSEVQPGSFKILNYIAELHVFRGSKAVDHDKDHECDLNEFVSLLANINEKFGDDAEEQRVFLAVTDKLFETTSGFYRW
jgi:hypothetical protein